MASRAITPEERIRADELLRKARAALKEIENYDQACVDRLCQAIAWGVANEKTFTRLAQMGVEESQFGDPVGRISKRLFLMGILRDVLREKSVGVIEETPGKGITKYAKPIGVIASLIPSTNPEMTPPSVALFALKCKDVVIFSPHPRTRKTTFEVVRIMREALKREGAPPDILQCIETPSIPLSEYLMSICDLVHATGSKDMVRAAYSSGTPSLGVGAGNATMIIDETADIEEAARNTRISKTSDFGSGCSADGNLIVEASLYDKFLTQLIKEGGYLASTVEKQKLQAILWDSEGHRTPNTVAISPQSIAVLAGIDLPADRKFIIVQEDKIGKDYLFSSEKLCVVLAIFKYSGFENALNMLAQILEVGGKGHSCGIYSFDDDHINQLALMAPVSRIMVRQPQSKANAGSFTNGMPLTTSLGCGSWGRNSTSENIHLKHYMNVTWVSRPIPEDRPSERELFGEFYNTETH